MDSDNSKEREVRSVRDVEKGLALCCFYVMDPAGWFHFSNGCYVEPLRYC